MCRQRNAVQAAVNQINAELRNTPPHSPANAPDHYVHGNNNIDQELANMRLDGPPPERMTLDEIEDILNGL